MWCAPVDAGEWEEWDREGIEGAGEQQQAEVPGGEKGSACEAAPSAEAEAEGWARRGGS